MAKKQPDNGARTNLTDTNLTQGDSDRGARAYHERRGEQGFSAEEMVRGERSEPVEPVGYLDRERKA